MKDLIKLTKFKVICKRCGAEAELEVEDDGACSDPECCGGTDEWIEVKCPSCGEVEYLN